MFWENCSHWDKLLAERAKISGYLITRDQAQQAIKRVRRKD